MLSGLAYAGAWWPSPHLGAGVASLRQAWLDGRDEDVHSTLGAQLPWLGGLRGDCEASEALRQEVDGFWSALRSRPYRLGGHQAAWAIGSELRGHRRAAPAARAEQLGATDGDHVSPLSILS